MKNIKNFFPCLIFLWVVSPVFSQNIPNEKLTDWSKAGILDAVPAYDTVNVLDNGIFNDGLTSNNSSLQLLMDSRLNVPTVFYFPAGNYFFDQSIGLSEGHVMKGASAEETIFTFNLNGANDAIIISGKVTSTVANINVGQPEGLNILSVENTNGFNVGDFIRIQFDDAHLVTSPWAEKSTGQILKIIDIDNENITASNLIRRAIDLSENPFIEKINPLQFAGVECLHIERMDMTDEQTNNIYFEFAANCWVKGVSSHNTNFAHVDIENSAHIHVTGSHFKDAFEYGNGGKGYGVVLEFNTSDCLVDNNIFDHLRHSMLLQAGANGNVLSYNYSINPFWDEVGLPDDAAGDLVLHGNYPYLNLFEGNIVQNIVIDDSHGTNGPGNMFFRNRAEHYGIFMNDNIPTDGQSFIGNEITSTNFLLGFYNLAGAGHFEFGNNVKGSVVPVGTQNITNNSFYLSENPEYFSAIELEIPTIGFPNNLNSGSISVKERFAENEMTQCEIIQPDIVNFIGNVHDDLIWTVSPNPTSGVINIESEIDLNNYSLKIATIHGRIVLEKNKDQRRIDVSGVQAGFYFLILENEKGKLIKRITIVN